ncbi:phage baseplate protein [Wolbachia endosymbiont of Cylisticus convexus]|nr:phage baseplate protein [Wolbachia endosymbiont of Cylisticus convexus]
MLKLKTLDAFFKIQGMDAKTGKALEGIEHLKQSIIDILTTTTML